MIIVNEFNHVVNTDTVEVHEQQLARQYIEPADVVLELGARYGSVSCVINGNLATKTAQVVVEPDSRVWEALTKNKETNDCWFHIVKGFISKQPLELEGCGYGTTSKTTTGTPSAPSFTLKEIETTYQLAFNVLVADCEGFLGDFIDENPELLAQLRLIIFEADYPDKCDYTRIRNILREEGFVEVVGGFQNVWKREFAARA